ncbi:MAG: 7-carboxy-7-deazaguanine synthase [Pseudomonadota bacterium]
MTYSVKELFLTIQGEGAQVGRAAVFCRFSGCNLWTGREEDRATAVCKFCDTDFVGTDGDGGGKFESAGLLAAVINQSWADGDPHHKYVVFTGGEPLLQLDQALIDELHRLGFKIAIETNGTMRAPAGIDWICVSPKYGSDLLQVQGDELKLVIPQVGHEGKLPQLLARFEKMSFKHHFLQPLDGPNKAANTELAIKICQSRPLWRLSTQTHKILGIR